VANTVAVTASDTDCEVAVRVTLDARRYEGACEPGMTGDGIRVQLTVSD
jgi:hypothetical protein